MLQIPAGGEWFKFIVCLPSDTTNVCWDGGGGKEAGGLKTPYSQMSPVTATEYFCGGQERFNFQITPQGNQGLSAGAVLFGPVSLLFCIYISHLSLWLPGGLQSFYHFNILFASLPLGDFSFQDLLPPKNKCWMCQTNLQRERKRSFLKAKKDLCCLKRRGRSEMTSWHECTLKVTLFQSKLCLKSQL